MIEVINVKMSNLSQTPRLLLLLNVINGVTAMQHNVDSEFVFFAKMQKRVLVSSCKYNRSEDITHWLNWFSLNTIKGVFDV